MAMLAGPRQKKRYCLTPKGKPLFEDNDRFGTKMLEKMGWSKGKGLGKNEDGNQEFVRLKYKSDEQGLGFEDRDDQWTVHEKQFNGLLENLNGTSSGETNSGSENSDVTRPVLGGAKSKENTKSSLKDKISGQSLEEKSKNSKARVHYKKFTKGKDIVQYSEKDLANIFGKKIDPNEDNIYNQFEAFNSNDNEKEKEEKENTKKESGTTIINTGVSVNDYFKAKMEQMKAKLGTQSNNPFDSNTRIVNGVEVFVPSSKKRKVTDNAEEESEQDEVSHKKKKHKKADDVVTETGKEIQEEEVPRKKKKNKKKSCEDNESVVPVEVTECPVEEPPPKKKKKSKKNQEDFETPANDVEVKSEEKTLSKKEKRKSKKGSLEEVGNEETVETTEPELTKKKKKNKKETVEVQSPKKVNGSVLEIPAEETNTSTKSKKKKNKEKISVKEKEEVSSHCQDDLNNENYLPDSFTISTFCAEKFRNLMLQEFKGSNLTNINGYGLSENLELEVKEIAGDVERISRLWNGTLDKYTHGTSTFKMYSSYMDKVKLAKSSKTRAPAFKLKGFKRKQMFQAL